MSAIIDNWLNYFLKCVSSDDKADDSDDEDHFSWSPNYVLCRWSALPTLQLFLFLSHCILFGSTQNSQNYLI